MAGDANPRHPCPEIIVIHNVRGAASPLPEAIPVKLRDARRAYTRARSIRMEAVRIADERLTDRQFIGGIVDLTDTVVVPVRPRSSANSISSDSTRRLTAVPSRASPPRMSRLRRDIPASDAALPAISVLADGVVLAPLETLVDDVELPPDGLATPGPIVRS